MQQTPAHEHHNPDLLRFIPVTSKKIVEVGCSSGALAEQFRKISNDCQYIGIEIDQSYASLAQRYCNFCINEDIESSDDNLWSLTERADCWIFGDTLEHLKDPWSILKKIKNTMSSSGVIIACIPNVQHWSLQVKLSIGDFRYETSGLLDKTHLRWFTRQTIFELFDQTGFVITEGIPRIFDEPNRERFLPIIAEMAKAAGLDPGIAVNDSLPLQYVVKAEIKA